MILGILMLLDIKFTNLIELYLLNSEIYYPKMGLKYTTRARPYTDRSVLKITFFYKKKYYKILL